MKPFSFQEFKPTILFLVKFLGVYVVLNLIYGWYVTAWYPNPDPVTSWVSDQSAWILKMTGFDASSSDTVGKPTTMIFNKSLAILSVYEGCNGLNTAIVFVSFLFAFGPYNKTMIWFAPLGVFIIHLSNLVRIILLFLVAIYLPNYMYFTHKYLFTAFIYLFVFLLWVWWVARLSSVKRNE